MKFLFYISLIFLVATSCTKKLDVEIKNLNGNKISIFGHGGMGVSSIYPLNTFESIQKCLNSKVDGVEFDVQMTIDSILVAYHDNDLSSKTNMSGKIHELTWAEIKNARYTTNLYQDYQIVSVNSIFSRLKDLKNFDYSFDCKIPDGIVNKRQHVQSFAKSISKMLIKYDLSNNVFVESRDLFFIEELIKLNLKDRLIIGSNDFDLVIEDANRLGVYGVVVANELVSKEQVEIAHQNNLRVVIWNTDKKRENKDAIEKYPDFIQTDNIVTLKALLR